VKNLYIRCSVYFHTFVSYFWTYSIICCRRDSTRDSTTSRTEAHVTSVMSRIRRINENAYLPRILSRHNIHARSAEKSPRIRLSLSLARMMADWQVESTRRGVPWNERDTTGRCRVSSCRRRDTRFSLPLENARRQHAVFPSWRTVPYCIRCGRALNDRRR